MARTTQKPSVVLWVIQGLLAAVFLFAGGFKLALPLTALATLSPLPAPFLKFIGACEVTGAIGLILPGLLHIRTGLTPLAAAGLVIIMAGATVITTATQGPAPAVVPLVVGLLASAVAYGRGRAAPHGSAAPPVVAVGWPRGRRGDGVIRRVDWGDPRSTRQ